MKDDGELNPFGPYQFCRWAHWAIFFVTAVACGLLAGLEEDPQNAYFPIGLAAGICLFVETCYLAMDRWRVSLAYLLLVTTYLALTAGAAIAAYGASRYLFA